MKEETITPILLASTDGSWTPVPKDETIQLLEHKKFPPDAQKKILAETIKILSMCGDPAQGDNNDTGLVFGYVQSGKTMSFTTLAALACDNDFRMVIVIAGISKNLVKQSTERLEDDLRINERRDRRWKVFTNPKSIQDRSSIKDTLDEWDDSTFDPSERRSILITVMKNSKHLQNLIDLLSKLKDKSFPVLIIDDEGDQASLNTKASATAKKEKASATAKKEKASANTKKEKVTVLSEKEVSTIYKRINDMKNHLSNHTFVQYTATPQANLFINIIDRLSPNFIQLLTPGDDYTGGRVFFDKSSLIIKRIPPKEIITEENSLNKPTETLMQAMQVFFLGVVAGKLKKDSDNRSMMVHPSQLVEKHDTYYNWVTNIKNRWIRDLKADDSNPDKISLLEEFKKAYGDLKKSVSDLPNFNDLTGNNLYHAIRSTEVLQLNAKSGSVVNWIGNYSFILVGGQAMDRGFTVEGLTVSYMPRNIGVGNSDTIQQRARFFGYKKKYLGYCRVYLDDLTIKAYGDYVEYEEDVRKRLFEHKLTGKHLNDWDRTVVLDQMFTLTRKNVLSETVEKNKFGGDWFRVSAPHDSDGIIRHNQLKYDAFITKHTSKFSADKGHTKRTEEQKHLFVDLKLKEAEEELLHQLKYTRDTDSDLFTDLKSVLRIYLEKHKSAGCRVYLMKGGHSRERRLNKNDEIQQLFQGKNPKSGTVVYPGDAEIKDTKQVTIQIHILDIKDSSGAKIVYKKVPTIAVWVPASATKTIQRLVKEK